MKGADQEEDGDGGEVSRKKSANQEDGPIGDVEALSLVEYNRWLVTEENWTMAEEIREQHVEGENFRKAREDRHRERGQVRQQDTVEQMKEAKTKVDAHRRFNLEQGSQVKRDVMAWKEAANDEKTEWAKYGAEIKATQHASSSREVRDGMVAEKKRVGDVVKQEVAGLTLECEQQRTANLEAKKAFAAKVRAETADAIIDESKKIFFVQRKQLAKTTTDEKAQWETTRKAKRQQFLGKVHTLMATSKGTRVAAKNSKQQLHAQRQQGANEMRAKRAEVAEQKRQQVEAHAKGTIEMVNGKVAERFAPVEVSRRMLQHPHFAEVSAVSADVTSQISREIASSPRRMRRGGGTPGSQAALTSGSSKR